MTDKTVWVVAGNFTDRLKAFGESTLSVSTLSLFIRVLIYATRASLQQWWTDGRTAIRTDLHARAHAHTRKCNAVKCVKEGGAGKGEGRGRRGPREG